MNINYIYANRHLIPAEHTAHLEKHRKYSVVYRIGHITPATTLCAYTYSLKNSDQNAAEELDRHFPNQSVVQLFQFRKA